MRESLAVHTFVMVALLACLAGPSLCHADTADVVVDLPDTSAPEAEAATSDSTESDEPRAPHPNRVVTYYFHRTLRCDTCLKFEAYTNDAIQSAFPDELSDGTLEWQVVNLDEPDNEHFVDDYFITESSVVAVEFRGGEQVDWTNLDAIWGLVGDRAAFTSFIQSETGVRLARMLAQEFPRGSVRDSVAAQDDEPIRR